MNILAIGAHFDDVEIGCGGAMLKYQRRGHKTHLVVVTDSEYTNHDGRLIRSAAKALYEGSVCADKMKVSSFITMGYPSKTVRADNILIEGLNSILDSVQPDVIFTHWHADLHEDHYEIARASLVAARHYPTVLMYRSNWYHSTVEFYGRAHTDITSVIDIKSDLMRMHETEYNRRGEAWIDFMRSRAREAGLRVGTPYAEEFEVYKMKVLI